MIINPIVLLTKQTIERMASAIIVIHTCYSGVIVLIDKAQDVAIEITIGAGECTVIIAIGIILVCSPERDLVAAVDEGDGLCVSCPCAAIQAVFDWKVVSGCGFRERHRGASRLCLKGERQEGLAWFYRPAQRNAIWTVDCPIVH